MTIKLTATEAKAKILGLLDQVSAGEEVEITKHGRTVARLVGANSPRSLEGDLAGLAMTAAPDKELFQTDAPWIAR
ncbi:MAG: type II toxin-antitoxin system Phd/YefM family antitoxin [Candidatus Dormibacteria bacterium]